MHHLTYSDEWFVGKIWVSTRLPSHANLSQECSVHCLWSDYSALLCTGPLWGRGGGRGWRRRTSRPCRARPCPGLGCWRPEPGSPLRPAPPTRPGCSGSSRCSGGAGPGGTCAGQEEVRMSQWQCHNITLLQCSGVFGLDVTFTVQQEISISLCHNVTISQCSEVLRPAVTFTG